MIPTIKDTTAAPRIHQKLFSDALAASSASVLAVAKPIDWTIIPKTKTTGATIKHIVDFFIVLPPSLFTANKI